MILLSFITWQFKQFNRVELYTELMKCSPMILLPSITRQFKQLNRIELHRILQIYSYDPFSSNICQFRQFGWFQLTRTPKKLSYYLSSLNYWAVRAGILGCSTLNYFKIILRPSFPQLLASSSSSTVLNYIDLMKYFSLILFSPLLSSSSSSAVLN